LERKEVEYEKNIAANKERYSKSCRDLGIEVQNTQSPSVLVSRFERQAD
jgi:hypothetical protein